MGDNDKVGGGKGGQKPPETDPATTQQPPPAPTPTKDKPDQGTKTNPKQTAI